MLVSYLKIPFTLVLGVVAIAACDEGPLSSGGAPTLTVQLTDAPGDLAQANVKIQKVILIRGETGEGESAGRVEITPTATDWIDLLTLDGGKVQDLVSETIEPGTYRQLRLVVCEMYIKSRSGQIVAAPGTSLPAGLTATSGAELKLTSQCKSGFKVNLPSDGVTVDDGTNTLVIDFDVQRSFAREAGRSGKWIVTPALHGVRSDRDGTIGGKVTLQGVTLPVACGGDTLVESALLQRFVPSAATGATVRSGSTSPQGDYRIPHLAAGGYALSADSVTFANGDRLHFTAVAEPNSVTVAADSVTSSAFTVTGATCTPA